MKKDVFPTRPIRGKGKPIWWFATICKAVFPPVFAVLFRPKITGLENLPKDGRFIVQANHASYMDAVFIWYKLKRRIRCMAKQELFDIPIVGGMAARVYAFPVKRGTADRESIKNALAMLKRGEPLSILPQGTRVWPGTEEPFHNGGALIAQMANVPIIPIGIQNTEKIRPPERGGFMHFPKIYIRVGEPIYIDDYKEVPKKERLDAVTNDVMRHIFALRDNIPYEEATTETWPPHLYPLKEQEA